MKGKPTIIIFVISALTIGVVAGFFIAFRYIPKASGTTNSARANLKEYKFINPLLYSENPKSNDVKINSLKSLISNYISTVKSNDNSSLISVYFRDLNTGAWTGVGEDEVYKPSSMLKIVAMIAAFKQSEEKPSILGEKLYLNRSEDARVLFSPDDTLTSGYYSIEDLIATMIKYSDNDAKDAILSDPAIESEYKKIFTLLRLPSQDSSNVQIDFMSPKSFSTIFRSLYNSSLLQWNISEHLLSLLSETTFTKGLVDGVPAGTPISHKFGENTDELHDCGIVYYPNRPYLLCVMTKGADLNTLESAISEISKITYQYVGKYIATSDSK